MRVLDKIAPLRDIPFLVGVVAQLGERVVRNDEVRGSIPLDSTNFLTDVSVVFVWARAKCLTPKCLTPLSENIREFWLKLHMVLRGFDHMAMGKPASSYTSSSSTKRALS